MEKAQPSGIGHALQRLPEPRRDLLKTDFQGFDHGPLLGLNFTFLSTFLSALLSELLS